MKNIAKLAFKGLFIAVLFTSGSIVLSTAGANTVSAANATVSYNQVYEFLLSKGYTVISLEPNQSTKFDWTAETIINGRRFITTIYCNSSSIITNADMPV